MAQRYQQLETALKGVMTAGVVLMMYGMVRLTLAWMQARAGKSDLEIFATALTSSLKFFEFGLILLILAIIGRSAVRSRASRPVQSARQ